MTELPADAEYVEDASLFIWRPHGILDEAEVNKVLVDLIREKPRPRNHSIVFLISRSSNLFTLLSNMFFMSRYTGAFPMLAANG